MCRQVGVVGDWRGGELPREEDRQEEHGNRRESKHEEQPLGVCIDRPKQLVFRLRHGDQPVRCR